MYAKLFESILDSSIWQESAATRLVWITMLAMKDEYHYVAASVPGLAKRAGVTMEECKSALEVLSSPDEYSRSKVKEGRRIEEADGGWTVVNGEPYRNLRNKEQRREYQREWVKEKRRQQKSTKVDAVDNSTKSTHTETDTYTDIEEETKEETHTLRAPPKNLGMRASKDTNTSDEPQAQSLTATPFDKFWSAVHLKTGKQAARRAFASAVKRVASERACNASEASRAITEAMEAFRTSDRASPRDRTAIYPSTWLNQGCYDDDQTTWTETPQGNRNDGNSEQFLTCEEIIERIERNGQTA